MHRRTIRNLGVLAAVTCVALSAIAAANAAGMRVIGSGHSAGTFAVTAASGNKDNAHSLWIRGYGRGLSGMGVVACSHGFTSIGSKSTSFSNMRSGKLYRLRMPFKGDCQITASLSGSGRIRLQILAT